MRQRETHLVGLRNIIILCILQLPLFAYSSFAQEQKHEVRDDHKLFYGLQLGITENKIDLYCTQNGEVDALKEGTHSFFAPGFYFGTIFGIHINRFFCLRTMPGMMLINRNWNPSNIIVVSISSEEFTIRSVCAELPIDVKFYPFHTGKWRPYLCSGFSYSIDLNSIQKDYDNEIIKRLNAHNFDYICGIGMDWFTRYLKVGIELKTSLGLLSPQSNNTSHDNLFYFHSSPTFSIGINVEA